MSCIVAVCDPPIGGMPWHAPQTAVPVEVHAGRDGPWHDAVHVAVARSQPIAATTSAGAALSRCPIEVIIAGTA